MKVTKGNYVSIIGGNPLSIYEVTSIRKYPDSQVALIWGMNTDESGTVVCEKLKVITPFWDENEEFPFVNINETEDVVSK